jgi:hypothetical protein
MTRHFIELSIVPHRMRVASARWTRVVAIFDDALAASRKAP